MKTHLYIYKWICLLMALLLLAGCTTVAATDTEAPPAPLPTPTEPLPEPVETELPTEADAGLSGVEILMPRELTVTAEQPTVKLTLTFTGVDPAGAPEGRLCKLTLYRDGEVFSEREHFLLTEGAQAVLHVRYDFYRYMKQTESVLRAELTYEDETVTAELPVRLVNLPDEQYAALSGDKLPYAISVIKNQNVVIVYGKDEAGEYTEPVKVFVCSTGRTTPRGSYRIGSRQEWNYLFGGVYGQYACVITGDILFHSVPYFHKRKDSLETLEYNKLGTTASLGCVRLCVRDAKWIYDFCPRGTSVRIFNEDTLTVEKPEPIYIDPESPFAGWDPTDPDAENPWRTEQEEHR